MKGEKKGDEGEGGKGGGRRGAKEGRESRGGVMVGRLLIRYMLYSPSVSYHVLSSSETDSQCS